MSVPNYPIDTYNFCYGVAHWSLHVIKKDLEEVLSGSDESEETVQTIEELEYEKKDIINFLHSMTIEVFDFFDYN